MLYDVIITKLVYFWRGGVKGILSGLHITDVAKQDMLHGYINVIGTACSIT